MQKAGDGNTVPGHKRYRLLCGRKGSREGLQREGTMDCAEFKNEVECLFKSISDKLSCILKDFYEPYGLTAPQAMILIALYRGGPGKISDMAKALNMTNSNLSVICRRLEKSNFVIRKRDDLDQRVVYLYLTESSKQLMTEMEARISTDYLCSLGGASDEDKALIIAGMTKLNELLTQNHEK